MDEWGVEQEGLIGEAEGGLGASLSSGEQRYALRGGGCEERADVKIENDDVKEHKRSRWLDVKVVVAVMRSKRRCSLDGRGEERQASSERMSSYGDGLESKVFCSRTESRSDLQGAR